jgi:hypothetical protein
MKSALVKRFIKAAMTRQKLQSGDDKMALTGRRLRGGEHKAKMTKRR